MILKSLLICTINIIAQLTKTRTCIIPRNVLFRKQFFSIINFYVKKNKVRFKKQTNIIQRAFKSRFHRHSPTSLATKNNNTSNVDINIPREVSYNSLQNSYILVQFEVTHNVNDNNHYADNIESLSG